MKSTDNTTLTVQSPSADRAIRIGFCVISLIFSYFAIRFSLSIDGFGRIFADMLGGKPLPELTKFVLQTKFIWLSLSVLCAVLPFGFALFVRRTSIAIYGISAATLVQTIQMIFLWTALTTPLVSIFSGMSGAG